MCQKKIKIIKAFYKKEGQITWDSLLKGVIPSHLASTVHVRLFSFGTTEKDVDQRCGKSSKKKLQSSHLDNRLSKYFRGTSEIFSSLSADPRFIAAHLIPDNDDRDNDKVYFFFTEKATDVGDREGAIHTRVGRVCTVRHFLEAED